jgi:hypothetical protein
MKPKVALKDQKETSNTNGKLNYTTSADGNNNNKKYQRSTLTLTGIATVC